MALELSDKLVAPAPRRMAQVPVHLALIRMLLAMPDEIAVVGARYNSFEQSFDLLIEHPSLPLCPEGVEPMVMTPIIAAEFAPCGHVTRRWWKLGEVEFKDAPDH